MERDQFDLTPLIDICGDTSVPDPFDPGFVTVIRCGIH